MKKKILIGVAVLVVVGGGYWGVTTYQEIQKGKKERANSGVSSLIDPNTTQTTSTVKTTAPTGPVRTFKLGPKSLIKWTGYKKVGQHSGWFELFEGTGKMPGTDITQASIELSIETDSCDTDNVILTGVMKDNRFFNCQKCPISTFKSVSIVKADAPNKFTVTGDLNLRDITKRIAFPATITVEGDTVKLDADFKVNRRWWNIVYESAGDALLYDDVRIELKVEAKEKTS